VRSCEWREWRWWKFQGAHVRRSPMQSTGVDLFVRRCADTCGFLFAARVVGGAGAERRLMGSRREIGSLFVISLGIGWSLLEYDDRPTPCMFLLLITSLYASKHHRKRHVSRAIRSSAFLSSDVELNPPNCLRLSHDTTPDESSSPSRRTIPCRP
jgi:hypothetical protein